MAVEINTQKFKLSHVNSSFIAVKQMKVSVVFGGVKVCLSVLKTHYLFMF